MLESKFSLHIGFNLQIGMLVLDHHVRKCLINDFIRKSVTSVGAKAEIGAILSTSSEPFVAPEKILVSDTTFDFVSCNYSVTTKSTSIFPP